MPRGRPKPSRTAPRDGAPWAFLTNHAHVLLCIADDPAIRLREAAQRTGVTERAVQRIVAELEAAGYLRHTREGRCNRYQVQLDRPLRHPLEGHCAVRDLVRVVLGRRR